MAYIRGDAKQIIVGAAAMFVYEEGQIEFDEETGEAIAGQVPDFEEGVRYVETLSEDPLWRNVGYTMNGFELVFQPDFGEVQVDQLLDAAKLYKQGMQVNLNTAFAEATLENLLVAIAAPDSDLHDPGYDNNPMIEGPNPKWLDLSSGKLGECPVERSLIAVGPGTGDCDPDEYIERIYIAYRALSIDSVTVSAKRDEPSMFEVSFRLLPASTGSYGRIVDRPVDALATS